MVLGRSIQNSDKSVAENAQIGLPHFGVYLVCCFPSGTWRYCRGGNAKGPTDFAPRHPAARKVENTPSVPVGVTGSPGFPFLSPQKPSKTMKNSKGPS